MSRFVLVENPAAAGKDRSQLRPACHDTSRFLTIQCLCGFQLHLHETQIAHVPDGDGIAGSCLGCGDLLEFDARELREAIAEAWT